MKKLLFILALATSLTGHSKESLDEERSYWLVCSTNDLSISIDSAVYVFEFTNLVNKSLINENLPVTYSIDDVNLHARLGIDNTVEVRTTPGNHAFQFYILGYDEIYTVNLSIESQYRDYYNVRMTEQLIRQQMKKPVIYLYPTEPTEVSVQVDLHGSDPFFYPNYEDGWKCTAMPNGDLIINDRQYNYLFWEASMHYSSISHEEGFIVSKRNVVAFLEKQLSTAGLNSQEQADFITFWGPQLVQHDQTFVHFIFNEECDQFAELKISPQPDHVYRISMLWQPIEDSFELKEQIMTPVDREGFTVIEWGGMELPAVTKNKIQ